ncbi:MAG TPA: galactokinase [Candidatus Sulfotelmatobacter sp.]|nr:galactokinase [Candidatus Sulfotelmatobacter sp.]
MNAPDLIQQKTTQQKAAQQNTSQQSLAKKFAETFRGEPSCGEPKIFRAPGRVNLIGEHTDYNDGFVLPAAIGFSAYVAAAPRCDGKLVIRSENFPGEYAFDANHLPARRLGEWCDYVLGVAVTLGQAGYSIPEASLLVRGEVPIGAGLSSSAAVEVATALALASLGGAELCSTQIARLCQKSENEFVGARVGIMDQYVSCLGKAGHVLFLDCRSLEFKIVPFPRNLKFVICNTMVKHELASGGYNRRREECERATKMFAKWDPKVRSLRDVSIELLERRAQALPQAIRKRCFHVVQENQRVLAAVRCLESGDLARLGELMRASHQSLRDQYEVSCQELDIMLEAAAGLPGYCGGRMTGGGFGGCTVNLVYENNAENFAAQISERYRQATGIDPQTYICGAEDGAQALG